MSELTVVQAEALRRFQEQRSRDEQPISLTKPQLRAVLAHLGDEPRVPAPETRSALDRLLWPDAEMAALCAVVNEVRTEPARLEQQRIEAEAAAAERKRLRAEAIAKLGLNAEQAALVFGVR